MDLFTIKINVLAIITELISSNFFNFPFLSCIADHVGDMTSAHDDFIINVLRERREITIIY